jgi:hypothetical protein
MAPSRPHHLQRGQLTSTGGSRASSDRQGAQPSSVALSTTANDPISANENKPAIKKNSIAAKQAPSETEQIKQTLKQNKWRI